LRTVIIFLLLIFTLVGGLAFLAFTSSGNAMLLPHINTYLKENVDGVKISLSELRLKPNSVAVVAKVNDTIDITAQGPIEILNKNFNLDYTLHAKEIKSEAITIQEDIHINGTAKGNLENIDITGKGSAFKSNISYALSLIDKNPKNIKFDMENANIEEILAVTGQKPYAKGFMTLHVDMPELDPEHPQGNATLKIDKGTLNANMLQKDLNISLPHDTPYSADFVFTAKGDSISVEGKVLSTLANLKLTNGAYNLKTQNLFSQYNLLIPDLSKLRSLTGTALKGKLRINGQVAHKDGALSASGLTHSFGGETTFSYQGDTLKAKLSNVKTATLLHVLDQPNYANGTTNANLTLTSLKALIGTFDLQTKGAANTSVIKKVSDINLGKKFIFNGTTNGQIKNKKVFTKVKMKTTMANIDMTDMVYDIKPAVLRSKYRIYIPDLGRLKPLTGKRYRGDMHINGDLTKAKDLVVTGHGKEFDGSIDFKLVNDNLKANVKGATVSKVMHMLNYPQVLEAISQAKIDHNIASGKGKVDASLDNARILPNTLTKLLKELVKIDLTRERYNNARFLANISQKIINFRFDAQNKNSHFKINKGVLNRISGAINAAVDIRIKNKDLKATIRGTIDKPRIELDASDYLKSKVEKKAERLIEKKLKLPEDKDTEEIKGFIKKLF